MNNAGRPVYKTSIYSVEDIDANGEPFELSLKDLSCGLVVIIDITSDELERLKEAEIREGSIVGASLMSIPNNLELTGVWRLWGNVKKLS